MRPKSDFPASEQNACDQAVHSTIRALPADKAVARIDYEIAAAAPPIQDRVPSTAETGHLLVNQHRIDAGGAGALI
jgi:hypothetical protein